MWFLSKQFKFCEFKKIYTSISDQRAYFCEKKFPSCSKNCMSFSRLAASIWHCSSRIIFVKSCCFFCAFSSAFIWTSCKSTNRSCKEIFSLFLEFFFSSFRLHFSELLLVISRGSLLQLISLFFTCQKILQELKKRYVEAR